MSFSLGIALEISAIPFDQSEEEENKDFICYICDRRYSRVGFLKAHFQRTHPGSPFPTSLKPEIATEPPKSTLRKTHSNIFNKIESPQICSVCSKSFTRKIDLIKHSFVHRKHGFRLAQEENSFKCTNYKCEYCNKLYGSNISFKNHTSLKCELCSGSHCRDWLYQKVMCKTEIECEMCKRELCKKCHKLHQESASSPSVAPTSYECVVCKELFPDKRSVKDHYAKSHAISKLCY